MRYPTWRVVLALTLLLSALPRFGEASEIPHPEVFLGHAVGADFKLAHWEQIVEYFHLVGERSERVLLEKIGRSTEDAPYIMATIAAPETLERLEHYKELQRLLANPDLIPEGRREAVISDSKCVVLLACTLHSSEIGASQMSMELLYDLATGDDAETREILDNVIVLLVPSANPDGIDKVVDWYERSLGQPWEGQGMPWLYQKYTGHDNNRDWFMVTQQETKILSHVLYHEWYPAILYDIHQMGNSGLRFLIPPYYDPLNPNVDPLINESLKLIGGAMATALSAEGKQGVASNAIFDMWWHGGLRSTPYRHNMIGILTEAASVNLASPIFQRKSELRGHGRGIPHYQPYTHFADPWAGGWWRLRDIVEYELIASKALFTLAARYSEQFNRNYAALGEKAIRLGKNEPPYAFLIPMERQNDVPTAYRMLETLHRGGARIEIAEAAFVADGVAYPPGTIVIHAAQPYRNHLLDLLQPQEYPARDLSEAPYDVSGWTLSYQMGVEVVEALAPFDVNTRRLVSFSPPPGCFEGEGDAYLSSNNTNNDFILLNRALKHRIHCFLYQEGDWVGPAHSDIESGAIIYVAADEEEASLLESWIAELGLRLTRGSIADLPVNRPLNLPRLGVYQPWIASIDEGWTRFVLEEFEFDYDTLHNHHIRAGNLRDRFDVILLPSISSNAIRMGRASGETEQKYTGGLGDEGALQLQRFVNDGGALLCLDASCDYAIDSFRLPVRNALEGVSRDEFFCPGSILRIRINDGNRLTYGMPSRAAAFFSRSRAFTTIGRDERERTGVIIGEPHSKAVYDNVFTLLSGWIHGAEQLHNKSALVSVPFGEGQVVLFGFRVQHRAQPHGTFRLLFNGIYFHR